ncbi:hypothetical protein GARC_2798 [Paraglaciecola arctica BSs20135]|uniref:Uncharacterized protein n=1 Tax=Paraglaciecola arctica BSs20135 TaxID=493475 RepID=K6YSU3_9ALTE|nr:hypothetical protein GARC_2798 [Paraglaciecola arctica BSs20135]
MVITGLKNIGKNVKFYLSTCCNLFFCRYSIVHCRTGSLETGDSWHLPDSIVHCRTGSLEI